MLQWARRYLDQPQIPCVPKERARVRSFLFFGTKKIDMRHASEEAQIYLHISLFLFSIGLVVFFFTIFKTVAVVLLICVGYFGLEYIALTIAPFFDYSLPHRPPMSNQLWDLWHWSLCYVAQFLHFILKQLHNFLVPLNLGEETSRRQCRFIQWLKRLFTQWLQTHRILCREA